MSPKHFTNGLSLTGIMSLRKWTGMPEGEPALSMKKVTESSHQIYGVWREKIEEFEVFHPDRLASRILGMGDVVSLVEKAQENHG